MLRARPASSFAILAIPILAVVCCSACHTSPVRAGRSGDARPKTARRLGSTT